MSTKFISYITLTLYTNFVSAQGVCDLFLIPLSEMRKEDGHVVRGIQQGASSFSINTATAAIDATQRLAGLIQVTFLIDFLLPNSASYFIDNCRVRF